MWPSVPKYSATVLALWGSENKCGGPIYSGFRVIRSLCSVVKHLISIIYHIFGPRRRVPKSHSSCSCCCYQFSRVQKSLRLTLRVAGKWPSLQNPPGYGGASYEIYYWAKPCFTDKVRSRFKALCPHNQCLWDYDPSSSIATSWTSSSAVVYVRG